MLRGWESIACTEYNNSRKRRSYSRSRRCKKSLLRLKERGDRSRLHCRSRSSCRRSGSIGGGTLLSVHVHVGGGLHTEVFPRTQRVHVLLVVPRAELEHHSGDRARGPVKVCGVTYTGFKIDEECLLPLLETQRLHCSRFFGTPPV